MKTALRRLETGSPTDEFIIWMTSDGCEGMTDHGRCVFRKVVTERWTIATRDRTIQRILNLREADETERTIERRRERRYGQ